MIINIDSASDSILQDIHKTGQELPGSSSTSPRHAQLPPPPVHPAKQYRTATISPPGYAETRRPTTTVTYTFIQQNVPANSMVLMPPSYIAERHLTTYCISVNMNCFTPSSYITTVKRGQWDGENVGDFEMGLTRRASTACIRGTEHPLSELFESSSRIFRNQTWTWKINDNDRISNLYWDDSQGGGVLTCFSSKERLATNLLAKFIPPAHPRKQARPPELTRLEITRLGHEVIDDIVISNLIVERMRSTPSVWQLSI